MRYDIYTLDPSKLKVGDVINNLLMHDSSPIQVTVMEIRSYRLQNWMYAKFRLKVVHSEDPRYHIGQVLDWDGSYFAGSKSGVSERLMRKISESGNTI